MAGRLPAGVFLSERECALLDYHLVKLLRDLRMRDGSEPRDLLEVAGPIHAMAVEFRETMLVNPGSGTTGDRSGSVTRVSGETERLSVQQAARFAGISESYVRRLARRGVAQATRSGGKGAWQLDGGLLAAWLADRNESQKAG